MLQLKILNAAMKMEDHVCCNYNLVKPNKQHKYLINNINIF